MEHTVTAHIRCSQCGSLQFAQPEKPKPDDTITCAGCGLTWRWDDFQRMGVEAGEQAILDHLRDAFRKL